MTVRRVAVASSPSDFARALVAALAGRGFDTSLVPPGDAVPGADAVVLADLVADAPPSRELVSLDAAGWVEAAEAPLARAMATFQAAHAELSGRGGRIVVVTPTAGLVGEAGQVARSCAIEAVRGLGKGAARQWRPAGITVNFVAPASPLGAADGVAAVVALFLGDDAAAVTGTTIGVDGAWVAP